MKKSVQVLISIMAGSLIGGLIALQMNPNFWWVGSLIGGLISYLVYDFNEVVEALKNSWCKVVGIEKLKVYNFSLCVVNIIVAIISLICLSVGLYYLGKISIFSNIKINHVVPVYLLYVILVGVIIEVILDLKFGATSSISKNKKRFFYYNPIGVCFYWPCFIIYNIIRYTPVMIGYLLKYGVKALKIFGIFIKDVFISIHSNVRLLCAVDAALGSSVGYFCGNVFVGMIVGGIWGLINYEIVSKKILKLKV